MKQAEMAGQVAQGQGAAVTAMVGSKVMETRERRDGTTGRIARTVPRIWAVRARNGRVRRFARCGAGAVVVEGGPDTMQAREVARPTEAARPVLLATGATPAQVSETRPGAPTAVQTQGAEVAFYRKYTEGMLRRYGVLSMEGGRVPSLLGREMFRGRVTSYRVKSFEDVVIFCHDVESCLRRLGDNEQQLLKRIALQEYTHAEAAGMLGLSLRSCIRQYAEAVDRLTTIFLKEKMLEPLKGMPQ